MKKILPVIILTAFVWGCAKKMTPAKTDTPTSNSGSVSNTIQPPSTESNLGKGTGTVASSTTSSSTTAGQGSATNAGVTGSRATTTSSPEAAAAVAGQATFNAKCGRCHGLKVTTNYTADRWARILAVMAPRANLTDTEKDNVYAYVKENSKK